jgi:ribonuclease Z
MADKFEVTILGSNSSVPANGQMLSSQVLDLGPSAYLFDCGEGTQIQLSKFAIKRNKIRAIFISHFHGDHLYGLPGLLTSYTHFERKDGVTIVGPKGIREYLETIFRISEVHLSFEVQIIETDTNSTGLIYEDNQVFVSQFPLKHRVPTQGFVFLEKINHTNLDPQKIEDHKLTVAQIKELKNDKSIEIDGVLRPSSYFLLPSKSPRKYVYCSDTSPLSEYFDMMLETDLLYHEATYLDDMKHLAHSRGHSTISDAVEFAQKIKAKKLIVGHFSSRYKTLEEFTKLAEKAKIPTVVAHDGLKIVVS